MVLGITGGIASGKSTLAGMLMQLGESHGVVLVSADAIARELLAPGADATRRVLLHFGDSIKLDAAEEAIDRSKLAARIFADEGDRKWLESVLHPIIDARIREVTGPHLGKPVKLPSGGRYCLTLAEIPLLYEVNIESTVDAVALAACSEQTQLRRLRERRPNLSEAEALRQIRTQIPISAKIELADFAIDTDMPIDDMRGDVALLFDRLVRGRV